MITKKGSATKKSTTSTSPVPDETREQKLARLAKARVMKAGNAIRLIGNLCAYKPTAEQVDKIMEALGICCANVDQKLRRVKEGPADFSL